ncbi:30S ribosome-binding factor RbfA [Lacticaseibacillus thailandensis]|uniref:Ribosome-binding factor A n=1 Tax=Lacticaseibacillus thailandensis DSM 22698 = JCM 13996 TaxID=1423810 RepID=A0A0R2CJC6_9LACO|nr:30S ribosome-binding factor RbfA [Lacticaseibacillus thailandensis]KRM88198.1 ribosome-binding factor A [Lacticaseibacillus thailandensis DSM 22698 = JCM 13996]
MKHRIGRVEQQIQREVDDILLKLVNDPRVEGVTITGVTLTGDLQQATIYFSVLDDSPAHVADVLSGLNKAKGLIRREVGRRIRLFKVPSLTFAQDTSVQYGAHIDELLAKANQEDAATDAQQHEDKD